ncbi:MAG: LPXTG cell wall anchor domain-containing protein [Actinomycetaceae bacterium]|nr:LPXTG cell wall anchor domain-containing protein [Actinomycetaceae bacterium]
MSTDSLPRPPIRTPLRIFTAAIGFVALGLSALVAVPAFAEDASQPVAPDSNLVVELDAVENAELLVAHAGRVGCPPGQQPNAFGGCSTVGTGTPTPNPGTGTGGGNQWLPGGSGTGAPTAPPAPGTGAPTPPAPDPGTPTPTPSVNCDDPNLTRPPEGCPPKTPAPPNCDDPNPVTRPKECPPATQPPATQPPATQPPAKQAPARTPRRPIVRGVLAKTGPEHTVALLAISGTLLLAGAALGSVNRKRSE